MKINEVERITGLTQKAIRLYEAKGLLTVSREENGYRSYTEEDVERLKMIRLLRSVGIAITDIKLYLFGVVSIEELTEKRKSEIMKESGKSSDQYRICEAISSGSATVKDQREEPFTESEEARGEEHGAISVGIDIGTTTVSAAVIDVERVSQIEVFSLPHNSYVLAGDLSEQSVSVIMEKAEKLLSHILSCYGGVVSIGISGQMHGIVYVNADGEPLSNLINWQDKRGDKLLANGGNACSEIRRLTGETVSTGYGVATHYYNILNGLVPEGATGVCSIMDLFAMRICGLRRSVTHASVAASFGLFDLRAGKFMEDKLRLIGIDPRIMPEVTSENGAVGEFRGIPVSVPLGDNQASVLGALPEDSSAVLVNIGTGSQVSAISDFRSVGDGLELRPFVDGRYLICGSALCGGFAYSMLESFFRSYTVSAGMQERSQYGVINQLAADAYGRGEEGLTVDVSFCGKRSDSECRGSITMIDRENFTPEGLALGILKGMCGELYELYGLFPEKRTEMVASGGAVRKNPLLKELLEDRFGMTVTVNSVDEEAATGAALFSRRVVSSRGRKS